MKSIVGKCLHDPPLGIRSCKPIGFIARTNPEELHINDPKYYNELYGSATRKRDKCISWVILAGTMGSSSATIGHDQHRLRRAALNSFFFKGAVTQLEPVIQEKVDKLCRRFGGVLKTGEVIRADAAYVELIMDVILQYSFANDNDYLSKPDFKLAWKETLEGAFEGGALPG
jgi:cytochrome P450